MNRIVRILVVVWLAMLPGFSLPNTEENRSLAADRYIAVIMERPMGVDMIKGFLQENGKPIAPKDSNVKYLVNMINISLYKNDWKLALMHHYTADELNILSDFHGSPIAWSAIEKFDEFFSEFNSLLLNDKEKLIIKTSIDNEIFRLGAVAPLTGYAQSSGISARRGTELAVKEWNTIGGVLGKPITIIFENDNNDPAVGKNAFIKLITEDKVNAIVGTLSSDVSFVGAKYCQHFKIPMISPTSSKPLVTNVGDYIFRTCFVDPTPGTISAMFAINNLKATKAACLFDDSNNYNKILAESFKAKIISLGGQVVGFESHVTGAISFRDPLRTVLLGQPNVLYVPDLVIASATIVKEARSLGFKGAIIGDDGFNSEIYVMAGGDATENTYFPSDFAKDDPRLLVRDFIKRFTMEFGPQSPDAVAVLAYDATNVMLEAVKRAGKNDGPAIRDALQKTNTSTVCGNLKFDENRNPVKPSVIMKIQGGKQIYFTTINP